MLDKISNIMQKGFGSKPVYNKKYSKTEIKCWSGKINTSFHDKSFPNEDSHYVCLSVVLIDSVLKIDKIYYP